MLFPIEIEALQAKRQYAGNGAPSAFLDSLLSWCEKLEGESSSNIQQIGPQDLRSRVADTIERTGSHVAQAVPRERPVRRLMTSMATKRNDTAGREISAGSVAAKPAGEERLPAGNEGET